MKRRSLVLISLAAALALAGVGLAYSRLTGGADLLLAQAEQGQVVVNVVGPGTVQARVPLTVSTRITASVASLGVDVGDLVKRGQFLAALDDRDLAARRGVVAGQQEALALNVRAALANAAKAQAELDQARAKQMRDADLHRAGFFSQAALDASDATLRAAQAGLDNARATHAAREADARALSQEARHSDTQLSFSRITAPMDGMIISRQAEVGSTVVPGAALFRMVDPATLWVAMRVDESALGRVRVGQAAGIRLRTGETASGRVARIARQSDAATRELEVDVAFDAVPARFAIDQQAEVAIDTGQQSGIVVPLAALARDGEGRLGVLAVIGWRTEFRAVSTGAGDGQRILIANGLALGDLIVARAEGVKAGLRVRAPASAAR